jgi:hypothetical protein
MAVRPRGAEGDKPLGIGVAAVPAGRSALLVCHLSSSPTQCSQRRWGMVNAPHLVALVRAGSAFVNGKLVERPADEATEAAQPEAA